MAKRSLEKYVLLVLGIWMVFFVLNLLRSHPNFLRHILPN
jgi:hypothetical protein